MTRALLTAAAIGTLAGLALTFGPLGAIGIAVCAAGVIAWYLVRAVRRDRRRNRGKVPIYPQWEITGPGLADLKPWPIGDNEVRR